MQLGIDIGGTFTDLVLMAADGSVHSGKTLTTPKDPAEGVINGLGDLLKSRGIAADAVTHVVHATTLVSNALIQRSGARTALITTRGFRDVLEMAREKRYDIYDLFLELPLPLVPRPLRFEVTERMDPDGRPVIELDPESLEEAITSIRAAGAESVAVSFLHSYANPEHERQAGDAVARIGLPVTLSSDIAPEIREYERTSTTVANAYVEPIVAGYLKRLERGLQAKGYKGPLTLLLSTGGLAAVEDVLRSPIRMVESGPAAGALIAARVAYESGHSHTLAFDMGGTTAKICLAQNGQPRVVYGFEVARTSRFQHGSGLPIIGATVELLEVGAGGGSIASVDTFGLLKVGPQSAEADPGPACYGRGGTRPTVTDANLLLGYLNPDFFLGGQMPLDTAAAESAISQHVAKPLGITVTEAAWGIYETVCENMASAARVHLAEKGADARSYTAVATGGAGPVHAFWVARKLEIGELICPPSAGVASAMGLLMAPPRVDLARSYQCRLDQLDWKELRQLYESMEEDARKRLLRVGGDLKALTVSRVADMRYVGQGHEIQVPLPTAGPLGPADRDAIQAAFDEVYRGLFSRTMVGVPVEALTWRVTLEERPSDSSQRLAKSLAGERVVVKQRRAAFFPDGHGFRSIDVYDRFALPINFTLSGPAIVEEPNSTCVIGPDAKFHIDGAGSIVCRLKSG